MNEAFPKVAQFKSVDAFRDRLKELSLDVPVDDEILSAAQDSPMAKPIHIGPFTVGNRWCIHPMEGWDANRDGSPSELTLRRWRHFGLSGAKLIWGGEAVAVRHDGRANPNQLMITEGMISDIENLRKTLLAAHEENFDTSEDLLVGLQLTHSGRFARPNDKKRLEPSILYHHPILDRKFGIAPDHPCLTDAQIDDLIGDFVKAAVRARAAGYAFIDLKHCHGYLGHEFLSATTREGRYGGSLENRTRFLREVVAGVRRDAPGLMIGVRLSAFDLLPFKMGEGQNGDRRGVPERFEGRYQHAFGCDPDDPLSIDLAETFQLFDLFDQLQIRMVCVSAGSPYYNPHIQRPALFPPSDGYQPPEDPLAGVARQIKVVGELKSRYPQSCIVGSGYSYLQEWLPHVAQHYVRAGLVDFVGLGRLVLSYHDLPADILRGNRLQTKRLCRTFSDCTTGPRNGLVSGCYPLDPFYRYHPQSADLKAVKQQLK